MRWAWSVSERKAKRDDVTGPYQDLPSTTLDCPLRITDVRSGRQALAVCIVLRVKGFGHVHKGSEELPNHSSVVFVCLWYRWVILRRLPVCVIHGALGFLHRREVELAVILDEPALENISALGPGQLDEIRHVGQVPGPIYWGRYGGFVCCRHAEEYEWKSI